MANGAGGRPPKPTAIKELEGNPGKRPLNDSEPKFIALVADAPPPWLDELGREHWLYHAPLLAKAGVLSEADASLLAAAAEQWSVYRRASAATKGKSNRTLVGLNRFGERVPRIEVGIARNALASYMALMREFGVGPASRSKVRVDKPEEKDEFSELFS